MTIPNYTIYGGSVYCSLPSIAVEYLLECDIAKQMLVELKYSAIGEEIFFQTVFMNSPFKSLVIPNNLRYSDWSVINAPKVLNESDFNSIVNSKVLFCRKVDKIVSDKLLEILPVSN